MSRLLLCIAAATASTVGSLALLAPAALLSAKGVSTIEPAALAMTRTVGVALLGVGALDFACRDLPPSPTLRRVLAANLGLQLLLLPLDPYACAVGAFHGVGSYLPNTILHLLLVVGFAAAWARPVMTPPARPPVER